MKKTYYRILSEFQVAAKKASLHEICVEAVEKMVSENIYHHVTFVSLEDNPGFGPVRDGKIPKVTIEWVDESEADPENLCDENLEE